MQKIDINLKPSQTFGRILCTIALLTLCSVWLLPWLAIVKTIFSIGIIFYVFYLYELHILKRHRTAIQGVRFQSEWQVKLNNQYISAEIQGSSTLTPYVAILLFRCLGERHIRPCVIFADALLSDDYRQLITCINTHKIKA